MTNENSLRNTRFARQTFEREDAKESEVREESAAHGKFFASFAHSSLLRVKAVRPATWVLLAGFAVVLLAGCTGGENPPAKTGEGGGGEAVKITNRIDIPAKVVQNLGITFAQVESRRVEQTLRAPGQFESPPEARREYHTMLPGRVEILVTQYQQIEPGTPLFRLESPEWRKIQEGLAAADSAVTALSAERKVLQAERNAAEEGLKLYPARVEALDVLTAASAEHVASLQDTRDHWQSRVNELEELIKQGAGKASELADARGQLKSTLSAIAEEDERKAEIAEQVAALNAEKQERQLSIAVLDSRLESKDSEIKTAKAAFDRALQSAAGSLGYAVVELKADDAWRTLDKFTVEATAAGIVNHVHASTGAWVDANTEIIATLDMTRLRFRAKALQADLGLLKEGLSAHVVPPEGGSLESAKTAEGVLRLPVEADAGERVVDLLIVFDTLPGWARPGVTAEAEVVYNPSAREQMAIPARCVVQDGLDKIVFVRDPESHDKVIRATPQLGASDGRWIVIYTDVTVGQDVVLDGVYELKLTGSGKAPKGGHFHADGTWHEGGHEGE